jgi:hypothetical protein
MKVGGHQLVGIAVTVFSVPADFEGGLDAMIQFIPEFRGSRLAFADAAPNVI